MELIHASGRARSIGVSNFTETHLKTILKTAKVKPAINQVEFHPCIDQRSLLAFAKQHDIRVAAFSSLTPTTKLPDAPVTHVVRRLAAKYGVDEGVILLRWVLGQHVVVVTTSGNETRLKGYLEVLFEETLSADEMKEIETQGQETSFRGFFSEEFKMLSPSSEVAAVAS
jgi:diketogulonate reductase-like aldo/keto reductase